MDKNKNTALLASVIASLPFGPINGIAVNTLINSISKDRSLSPSERLELLQSAITIRKELSIAHRIESAEKVTLEEYYEASGEGKADGKVNLSQQSGEVSLGGNGQRVTKRVYTFEGVREPTPSEITMNQQFMEQIYDLIRSDLTVQNQTEEKI